MKDPLLKLLILSSLIRIISLLLALVVGLIVKIKISQTLSLLWFILVVFLAYSFFTDCFCVFFKNKLQEFSKLSQEHIKRKYLEFENYKTKYFNK